MTTITIVYLFCHCKYYKKTLNAEGYILRKNTEDSNNKCNVALNKSYIVPTT